MMIEDFLKSKKIMLVDDEPEIVKMLLSILREEGFLNLIPAGSVKEALQLVRDNTPDLCILDVMLADGTGFDLMKEINKTSGIPVIFLTAKDESKDKIEGFSLGADDYITKPFLPKELLMRINAVLRRCYKDEEKERIARLTSCIIDFSRAEIIKENNTIPMTAKEYEILDVLVRNANRVVTIDALCEAAWGENPFGYENSLMTHIRRIREKIEINPSKPISLLTIKGLGYKLMIEKGG